MTERSQAKLAACFAVAFWAALISQCILELERRRETAGLRHEARAAQSKERWERSIGWNTNNTGTFTNADGQTGFFIRRIGPGETISFPVVISTASSNEMALMRAIAEQRAKAEGQEP